MPSKQVIETDRMKPAGLDAKGLYVGGTESKYAVITDEQRNKTVLYDKVTYNFGVTDLATNVPASGGTYSVVASTSTRTHGNGAVDSVTYSPTTVTIPANTGASYTSSVTITQTTSNLTDQYNYTVTADSVKSIVLTISNPATIPASGGSVNTCTTSATVTYHSGRVVTSFTPTSVNFNTVSASSRGTTTGNTRTAGTLTCYVVFGGVTSNTASVYVNQAANVEGTTEMNAGNSAWTATVSIGNGMTAAGGSATVTHSAGHVHYYRHQYTSGSYTGWYTNNVTDTSTITITTNGNSAFSLNGNTLTHSNMGTTARTDNVTITVTNASNTSITNTASKSIVNQVTNSDYDAQSYTASITIGNGITAAGGSATVTASASHQARYLYTSGSYTPLATRNDGVTVTEISDPNNRYSYASGTLSHSNMTTNATTDSCTLRATNNSNTTIVKDASVSVTNQIETPKYNEGNSAWTATISIGNGITAAGGSATVTANASHVHYWQQKYTSGSYVGSWYTQNVSDTPNVTEDSDNNNRYTYSNGTLTHSTMGTYVGTDTCTLRVRNASNTATTNVTSVSVSNAEGTTEMNAGNSAWTATVSIGNGMTAAGGSATVTHSAGHVHYYRHQYTSGSYTGWYTNNVTDTSTISITTNGNSAFSLNGNTLTHSGMGTTARTDSVTITVTNTSNTSVTNTDSKSIVNQVTNSDYDAQSYTASISIGNGITAAGGSATVNASASHQARYLYTSGSYTSLGTRNDGVTVTEVSDPNNRYSYANGTLSHSNMTTNATTDSCTLRATNNSNTSATKDASVNVTNQIESPRYNEGNSAWTATISIGNGITAAGGSATVTANASHVHYWQQKYTSGSYVGSWYTQSVTDTPNVTEESDTNNRYSYSNGTLTHSNMTSNVTTDSCTLRVRNSNNTATTNTTTVSVSNKIEDAKYNEGNSAWTSTVSIGDGMTAAGGSATVTYGASHIHYWQQKYTSGTYVGSWYTRTDTDNAKIEISSNGNNRFSMTTTTGTSATNTITLSHSNMTTNATTDSVTVKVTNLTNTSQTGTASKSVSNAEGTTEMNAGNSAWTATISIGNGITAAGGSATVTANASHVHYYRHQYTSGSYTGWYTSTVTDTADVTENSDPNSRYSYASGTLTHSNMTTNATTDSCTLRVRNHSNTATTNTASVSVTNQIESTKYNEGNSAYTATISIGNGITAAGGSATVTASAGHTHYWQQKYTSGSYVSSWYTSSVSDTANVTEDSDPNNRYSYSNGTLTHSSMGTYVGTDSCTLRVRNASNTATTNTATVSATNAEGTTEMNAGNSAWTATISIGSGINAGGGSAKVTASAGHTHYYRHQYTSGSYTGWYTNAVSDSATVTETEDTNNRFSYSNGTLSHSSMGTWTGTEYCTLKVTNANNTSTTSSTRTSVSNSEGTTEMNAGNSAWTATISIGNGITAGGGSATVTASAGHTHYYRHQYTSGSYTGWYTSAVSDTPTVTETEDTNNRFSYSNGTLTHSSMGSWTGTEYCTLKVTNASNTSTTSSTRTSVSNSEGTTEMNAGNSAYTASISIGNGITAGGGSATVTASAGHTHYYRHQYTSGSYTGWYTNAVTDGVTVTEQSDNNNRYSYSNGTLTHSSMGTSETTDSCTLRATNNSSSSAYKDASVSVTNQLGTTKYNEGNSAWTATISIGNGITAGGGSATVTANASHVNYWRYKYTSGSYTGWYTNNVTDTPTVTETEDTNSRFSYSNGTLSHNSMGSWTGTEYCTLKVTNASNTNVTSSTRTSVTNQLESTKYNEGNSGWTATISIGNGITAAGGSATVTANASHVNYWRQKYTSGSYTGWYTNTITDTPTVTETEDTNSRFSYSNGTLSHSSMGTWEGTEYCTLKVTNASYTSKTASTRTSVTNAVVSSTYGTPRIFKDDITPAGAYTWTGGTKTITYSGYLNETRRYTSNSTQEVTWYPDYYFCEISGPSSQQFEITDQDHNIVDLHASYNPTPDDYNATLTTTAIWVNIDEVTMTETYTVPRAYDYNTCDDSNCELEFGDVETIMTFYLGQDASNLLNNYDIYIGGTSVYKNDVSYYTTTGTIPRTGTKYIEVHLSCGLTALTWPTSSNQTITVALRFKPTNPATTYWIDSGNLILWAYYGGYS